MKLGNDDSGVHLTYCTNIHRAETWAETKAALERHLPDVKRRFSADVDMGVGLGCPQLSKDRRYARAAGFRSSCATGLRFSINGFVRASHGTARRGLPPDCFAERLAYTNRLAD
jgi:hypothetical protein